MTVLYGGRPALGVPQNSTIVTAILDGSGDKIGGVFVAPKDGTIDRLACYCTAVSSPVSTDIRLEGVNAGVPSGSLVAANTSGSFTPVAATLHLITMTASHVVAAGDLVAVVLNAPTASGAATQTFNLRNSATFSTNPTHYPRAVNDLSVGTWSLVNNFPCVSPVYSDGSYFPLCIPNSGLISTSFSNGSTPDERGIRWTQVGNMTCVGCGLHIRGINAGCNFNVKLYPVTSDSASPLATFAGTSSTFFSATSADGLAEVYWDGVDLVDGTDYRITLQPSTANNVRMNSYEVANQQIREAASHYKRTTRTRTADGDAGAWTDVETAYEFIYPLFSQSNASASVSSTNNIY